ncbi:MAG: hypothetical protein Q9209_004350 [Squamulea sp. 1 TL-2023]
MKIHMEVDNCQIMNTWLDVCRRHHKKCSVNLESFLPTRLLDLCAFETEDIRLVASDVKDIKHGDLQPEYTALSHCWGPPERHPIKTTTKNLDEMMTRILINKLPNTFRDAVYITRELGKQFLWIDSLCIIQDDEDDWAKESALMASVYGQSYCTLAAHSSQNATEGCRLVPHIQTAICRSTEIDTQDEYHNSYRIRFFEREPRDWHKEYGDNPYTHSEFGTPDTPLRSRAWTLQERELSVRKIHFSKDQLLWECCELKASAQLPWHHKTTEDDFEMFPVRNALAENIVPGGPVAMRDRWYQLMEDYSTRSLTNELDTLPALSGLAQQYQDIFPAGQYLAGMWSNHMPAALLWRSKHSDASQTLSYIAPTWSWASVRGPISFDSQRLCNFGGTPEQRPQESSSNCDFGDLQVGMMQGIPRYSDKYGAIKNATLVLHDAVLTTVDPCPHSMAFDSFRLDGPMVVLTKDGVTVGLCYPDTANEFARTEKLYCLRVRVEIQESQISQPSKLYGQELDTSQLVMGLILGEDPGVKNRYKRKGLARWIQKSLFDSQKPTTCRLI